MVYGTVSILCIVARMFHNGNIITDKYSILHMLQIRELLWRESLVLVPCQIM